MPFSPSHAWHPAWLSLHELGGGGGRGCLERGQGENEGGEGAEIRGRGGEGVERRSWDMIMLCVAYRSLTTSASPRVHSTLGTLLRKPPAKGQHCRPF